MSMFCIIFNPSYLTFYEPLKLIRMQISAHLLRTETEESPGYSVLNMMREMMVGSVEDNAKP